MEHIGSLLKNQERGQSLVQTSNQPPPWAGLLLTIAQTKGKEMTPGEMQLWQNKLGSYQPDTVKAALLEYRGDFFPDPNAILKIVERLQESAYQAKGNRAWEKYKLEQAEAERTGKMATEADYESLRKTFQNVAGQVVTAEQLQAHRKGYAAAQEAAKDATANGRRIPAHDLVGMEKSPSD